MQLLKHRSNSWNRNASTCYECYYLTYPELSCSEKPIGVPSGGIWPITEIYCAGKDSTFEFLENVLLEVMELFPSKYIHIGGDEATKTNWGFMFTLSKKNENGTPW